MFVAIRIKGRIDISYKNKTTFELLKLRRKFACAIYSETKEIEGMLKRVENYIAYGKIDEKTLKELIIKRGRLTGNKKVDEKLINDKLIKDVTDGKVKLEEKNIKPFFRLNPPRGGFKKSTKKMFPNGILGNNKEKINEFIITML
ncbi:hypothetical protein AUJ10_00935 [Candidatus Pacearchaeota archaeon CG1_02_31_27]|nr:MAG: hypothetical protein AUJ10_00935 [Candidatus Pacearchaeota archaeon CG1_02_31_27]